METIRFIFIGEFFDKENFIRLSRLLPVPEINIAVFTFLRPINFTIKFKFFITFGYFSNDIRLISF